MSNETYSSSTRIFKDLLDEIGKVVVDSMKRLNK